ncbi:solute carrier family 52, riboflavin transporter, member 3-B-like [Glandiceps talaboti]
MGTASRSSSLSVLVQILVCLLGMASWIDINGVWVELPLMVWLLPENWNLPSYLVILIQVANIGPLLFLIISKLTKKKIEIPTNYIIISVGALSCLLLAFLWDRTSYIGGANHSTAFLTLCFFLSLVDCTSSVSFLAFMASFPKGYLTAYFVGESLSGLVPSILALIQGVGGNAECINTTVPFINETVNITEYQLSYYYPPARFSVQTFFVCLFVMLMCSLIASVVLNHLPAAKKHKVKLSQKDENDLSGKDNYVVDDFEDNTTKYQSTQDTKDKSTQVDFSDNEQHLPSIKQDSNEGAQIMNRSRVREIPSLSMCQWVYLLTIQAWVNGVKNGFLSSIQSYSALPYGNVAYHLAITLSNVTDFVTCIIVHFFPTKKLPLIGLLATLYTGFAAYVCALAILSPEPVLCGSIWGEILMVVAWILVAGLRTYLEVVISMICRQHGRKALIWCGVSVQLGSLISSIVGFFLVNNTELFTSNNPCDDTCYN